MQKTKTLIIKGMFFFIICVTHLFFSSGINIAEAADQAILAQMQAISSSPTGVNLVQAASPEKSPWKGRMQAGLRSRAIQLNPQINKEKPLSQGTNLVTHLFDDVTIESNVLRSARNINGVTATTAKIVGSEWGRVFIAESNGQVRVKILAPEQGKIFSIEYNKANGLHYALELDPELLQAHEDEPLQPPEAVFMNEEESIYQMMSALSVEEDESADVTTVVDVMVVYSNDALTYAGSVDEINNIIALGIAMANDAHEKSNTGLSLHLVHSEQIDYTGSGNHSTDLERLQEPSDGYMDEVHTLRDNYGADFVSLMPGDYSSSGGNGGIAYVLTSSLGDAPWAFSVVSAPTFDSYTPAHEIGHNMGLSHAKDQNSQAGPTSWYRDNYNFGDSSAGWHWHPVANQAGYSSIMAYTSGNYYSDGLSHTKVGLFSDPNISYEGFPSGHINDGYNALVLRSLKNVYASYRDRPLTANSIGCGSFES